MPTNVVASNVTANGLMLNWTASTDNVRFETPNGVARLAAPSAEIPAEGRLTVGPNPTSGPVRVQVLCSETTTATLSVLNRAGVPVVSQSVRAETGENTYALDLSRLAPEMYLVRWGTGTERLVRKVVLVK